MNVLILLWNENVFCDTKFLLCFFWNVYLFSIVFNKTGSFNSFLFIYLTVINWDGNTKQRNLHLRLSPGFILHQCCYLNITVVVFVMRTKEYDFIMKKKIHPTVFAANSEIIKLQFNPCCSWCISWQKSYTNVWCYYRLLSVNGISISSLFLLFYIPRYMLLCICRKRRFLYIVVKPAN